MIQAHSFVFAVCLVSCPEYCTKHFKQRKEGRLWWLQLSSKLLLDVHRFKNLTLWPVWFVIVSLQVNQVCVACVQISVLILDQHYEQVVYIQTVDSNTSQCCTYTWNCVSECKLVAFVSIVCVQSKIRLFYKTIISQLIRCITAHWFPKQYACSNPWSE